ncbi:MAG: hypothetical protein LBQ82_03080 [Treponema sp.]|nr:hypothetical protein [Treponema sp.]
MIKAVASICIIIFLSSCKYMPVYVEKEFDLNNEFEFILQYETNKASSKAEFILEGEISGLGKVEFFAPPNNEIESVFHTKTFLIKDNIKFQVEQTWYEKSAVIKYVPIEPSTGKLLVKFRVY